MQEPELNYRLRVLSQDMSGVEFPLVGDTVTIGRLAGNEVCLPLDLRVSRRHARLRRVAEGWLLEDLGSANGTYTGQLRVHGPVTVQPGDQIRVGRTWLQLEAEEPQYLVEAPRVALSSPAAVAGETPEDSVLYSVDAEGPALHEGQNVEQLQAQLEALSMASAALSETLEWGELLETIMDLFMRAVRAERGFLLLPDQDELVPRVARWHTGTPMAGAPVTLSRNIVERAASERRVILSSDATTDERFATLASVRDFQIRSIICAPLVRRGEVLAVVFLDTASGTRIFSEADVDVVTAIASQAASAMEGARLFTALRRAYQDLEEAQDQLVRSEKLSTIGTLAASLAHDMSNIIAPLNPLVTMLVEGKEVSDKAREILKREIRRLGALVQTLYSFAGTSTMRLRPVQVNEILQEGLALLNTEAIHRGVQLETSLAEDLPYIQADPDEVYRAVLNLIMNALDATEGQEGAVITVTTLADEDEVVIGVADNGPGIKEEVQRRLFQPFYTTKPSGTGLGLYSCRRIIEEEHGGTVQLDSQPGKGTQLWLRLPALTEERKAS